MRGYMRAHESASQLHQAVICSLYIKASRRKIDVEICFKTRNNTV